MNYTAPTPKQTHPRALRLMHEGALALADVEAAGMRIDMKYLMSTIESTNDRIHTIEDKMKKDPTYKIWRREFGDRTDPSNREQLKHVVYNKLKYKVTDRTATGQASTNKNALEKIDLPIVKQFTELQSYKTTMSSFLVGLKDSAVYHDGDWYIHPIYNLNIAATFRSSCQFPNLQNVPKRDEEIARMVRRAFLPLKGHHLLELDFSVLEVRIAYTYHQDPVMRKYLLDGRNDMHRDVACELFFLTKKQVEENKKTFRHSAKNQFVFAEFYGSVYFQCAKSVWESCQKHKWAVPGTDRDILQHLRKHGVKELGEIHPDKLHQMGGPEKGTFAHHMKTVEQSFWKRFNVYDQWRKDWYKEYLNKGYFALHTGFVIHTEHKRNDVICYPVQGAAFHCLLWCIIELNKWLRKNKMRSKIVGQIHDNLMLSVHPKEMDVVSRKAKEIMTQSLPEAWKWINIPLKVEVEAGGVNRPWSEVAPVEVAV